MADIIQLLPDSIANQIAAGEVIHRPAAVVKELVENAIDAQSKHIKLVIKDSGKTLIQVIDDGLGMSDTDARMAFERHATSKISKASDLFHIHTKGFRGEALASIAAIAHVELITRKEEEPIGRTITIQGSSIKKQEPCQASKGTTISVKNLFFNVPARRKFLKSDPVELKHIVEEYKRIALAHPEIGFDMYHNNNEVYILPPSNLRQRIVAVFGKSYNDKIIPAQQEIEAITINGFVGKPEASKRTKGDQYLFVNNRFIKSNYFNHAIRSAYEELIAKESYPFYCLYLTVNPEDIDINVHPTKTEVKFENERIMYNYIKVAIKHALGQYSVTPQLDFGSDVNFSKKMATQKSSVENEYNFNPAEYKKDATQTPRVLNPKGSSAWQQVYDVVRNQRASEVPSPPDDLFVFESAKDNNPMPDKRHGSNKDLYQIHSAFIMAQIEDGFILVDQQAAHERILYDKNIMRLKEGRRAATQKELFPRNMHLEKSKATFFLSILDEVNSLGYQVEHFGGDTFLIQGTPTDLEEGVDVVAILESLIDDHLTEKETGLSSHERICRSIAKSSSIKKGKTLSLAEMKELIDQLFECAMSMTTPSGKKTYATVKMDDIHKLFIP